MGIVLIGYRGSGKTTVGRLLAERLGCSFVDLDELIVRRAGMTIRQIFDRDGEAEFRRIESEVLTETLPLVGHVISLGGGAILRAENRAALKGSAHRVVHLHAGAAELHNRITADPETAASRPSLTGLGGGLDEIHKLLEARRPLYREVMHVEIDVTGKTPLQVALDIQAFLRGQTS
jgi:shikimate kinase